MPDHDTDKPATDAPPNDPGGNTAVQEPPPAKPAPRQKGKPAPKKTPPQPMPPWKVLLHNDDVNDMLYVVGTLIELTPLDIDEAKQRTLEANDTGVSLILVTHKERAELYQEQFASKQLTVTIEPAE